MDNIKNILNKFYDIIILDNGWYSINTSFLDSYNDGICIYIKEEENFYRITDDSYTLSDYEKVLKVNDILSHYSVKLKDNEIYKIIKKDCNLHIEITLFLQALILINFIKKYKNY